MDDRLMYMDTFFLKSLSDLLLVCIYIYICVIFLPYSLFHKSVVQLKSFDNIFSDFDDASNVLSFRSFHSHIMFFFAIIN